MNKVFLSGRLVANPASFATASAQSTARFDLASNDSRNSKETYFFPCVAFGATANYIMNYCKKGDFIIIEGRITRRSYTTRDGKNGNSTDVIVDNVQSVSTASNKINYSTNIMGDKNDKDEPIANEEKPISKFSIDDAFINDEEDDLKKANENENSSNDDEFPGWMNNLDD